MPMILFPNVLVNSVSVLLMPAISEAYARKDFHLIRRTIKKTVFYCLLLGFSCTFGFLLTGKWIGQFIFQNTLAGSFILILSWICPFLYFLYLCTDSNIWHPLLPLWHACRRTADYFFILSCAPSVCQKKIAKKQPALVY